MDEIYKIRLTKETIQNLIPGEKIMVPRQPMSWSGFFKGPSPLNGAIVYPYELIINHISYVKGGTAAHDGGYWNDHTALLCQNGYGWTLESIISAGGYLINGTYESQNKFPFEIYKKNENWYIKN